MTFSLPGSSHQTFSRIIAKHAKYIALSFILLAALYPFFTHNQKPAPEEAIEVSLQAPKPQPKKIAQPTEQAPAPKKEPWINITAKKGDSLFTIFKQQGLSDDTLATLLAQSHYRKYLHHLSPKQRLSLLIDEKKQLKAAKITIDTSHELMIERQEAGDYKDRIVSKKLERQLRYISATIKHSLYLTGKNASISPRLLRQLAQIFYWEIDFAKDIRHGDQFTLIYEAYYAKDKLVRVGDIIAASFTNHGKEYQAIRYEDSRGNINYFDMKGKNLRRAFKRFPVKYTHVSSSFRLRRKHPILGITRAHKGIDLAAPTGTPIRAVANGRVQFIGRNGGYGNMVKIKHNLKYTTLYAHMLRFRHGLSKGDRVKQGQVIGYVGQTGLADGPHCHFEFHKYGRAVNPANVSLPNASPIPWKDKKQFAEQAKAIWSKLALYRDAHTATATT